MRQLSKYLPENEIQAMREEADDLEAISGDLLHSVATFDWSEENIKELKEKVSDIFSRIEETPLWNSLQALNLI